MFSENKANKSDDDRIARPDTLDLSSAMLCQESQDVAGEETDENHTSLERKYYQIYNLYLTREEECQKAKEIIELIFDQNIQLERQLNETKMQVNTLRAELEMRETQLNQLNITLCEREIKTHNLQTNQSQQTEIVDNTSSESKFKGSKVEKNRTQTHLDLNKIALLYERKIIQTLKSTRRLIHMMEQKQTDENVSTKVEREIVGLVNPPTFKMRTLLKDERFFLDIDIVHHDLEQKSICLVSRSTKSINIGNWTFESFLNGVKVIVYKFHKAVVIEGEHKFQLWSKFSQLKEHFPPTDFVINNNPFVGIENHIWNSMSPGDVITDILFDQNGRVMKF